MAERPLQFAPSAVDGCYAPTPFVSCCNWISRLLGVVAGPRLRSINPPMITMKDSHSRLSSDIDDGLCSSPFDLFPFSLTEYRMAPRTAKVAFLHHRKTHVTRRRYGLVIMPWAVTYDEKNQGQKHKQHTNTQRKNFGKLKLFLSTFV